MQYLVSIDLDGDAFKERTEEEVARILQGVVFRLQASASLVNIDLLDRNDRPCGKAMIKKKA